MSDLGSVQRTLFIPLLGRARETTKRRPILRDPKAAEMVASLDIDLARYGRGAGGAITVLRTAIFDTWIVSFLETHPEGTVVELGTGLNARFERFDNGSCHWVDLDLPDTIALRSRFFSDSDRRAMLAASVLDEDWLDAVAALPGPYFFVSEGVLVYLPEDQVPPLLSRIAQRFPDSLLAIDTYARTTFERQHRMSEERGLDAPWSWPCDDPRSLEPLGLRVVEAASATHPPRRLLDTLPLKYRLLLPLAHRAMKGFADVTLFRTRAAEPSP